MSDSFECVVDVEATPADAAACAARALRRLFDEEIVVGPPDPGCVLGGVGYRPGPRIAEIYQPSRGEARFWRLRTNGVEVEVGRFSNIMFPFDGDPRCPSCDLPSSLDRFVEVVGRWADGDGDGLLACSRCGAEASAPTWKSSPPVVFGHLTFRFWNWPPLTASGWRVDLVKLISAAMGHRVEVCWGRL